MIAHDHEHGRSTAANGMDFSPLIDDIARRVVELLADRHDAARAVRAEPAVTAPTSLDFFRMYTAKQAGEYLGLSANRVYEIPESELPRVRTGGRVRYIGINVFLYAVGVAPVDTCLLGQQVREQFLHRHAAPPAPGRPADRPPVKKRLH